MSVPSLPYGSVFRAEGTTGITETLHLNNEDRELSRVYGLTLRVCFAWPYKPKHRKHKPLNPKPQTLNPKP